MYRFIVLFLLAFFPTIVSAQLSADTDSVSYFRQGKGVVKVEPNAQVDAFMTSMKTADYKPMGYRVQLTSESGQGSQDRAKDVKSRFINAHKDVDAYLEWEAPNFKIRVGDFRTKFEAAMFWKQIQAEFPNSYVVECKINPGGVRK